MAIVEFDLQSGGADSWVGKVLSLVTADALHGRKEMAVGLVKDAEGWRTLGVGRFVSGNYRREAKGIRVHAQLTDAATSRVISQVDELVAEDQLVAFASSRLVVGLFGGAAPGGSKDLGLWKELALALEQPTSEKLSEFVAAHADFEPARPLLAERLLREGKTAEVARLEGNSIYAAQTAVILAGQGEGRLAALAKLVEFRPEDPNLLLEIGTRAGAAGQWALAAKQYQALTRLEPGNVEFWNSLGYAEANQNRLAEAVAALNQYRNLLPNEPNAIDSLGEVNYMNRQFGEAAKFFDEQWRRYPAFQNGVGLRKAAFAYYFAGDLKAADQRFEEWMKRVVGTAPPSMQALQRAMWLARTKRADAGMQLLKKEIAESEPVRKLAGELHLAMMEFGLSGKRPGLDVLQKWGQTIQEPNLRNEFSIFALLAQPAANLAALKSRIEMAVPQPQMAQLKKELLEAAEESFGPTSKEKPKIFPLPNAVDGPFDVILLRSRVAVLP